MVARVLRSRYPTRPRSKTLLGRSAHCSAEKDMGRFCILCARVRSNDRYPSSGDTATPRRVTNQPRGTQKITEGLAGRLLPLSRHRPLG